MRENFGSNGVVLYLDCDGGCVNLTCNKVAQNYTDYCTNVNFLVLISLHSCNHWEKLGNTDFLKSVRLLLYNPTGNLLFQNKK